MNKDRPFYIAFEFVFNNDTTQTRILEGNYFINAYELHFEMPKDLKLEEIKKIKFEFPIARNMYVRDILLYLRNSKGKLKKVFWTATFTKRFNNDQLLCKGNFKFNKDH